MRLLLIFLICFNLLSLQAQDSIPVQPQQKKTFTFIPVPVIGANPTYGWMFGVAPGAAFYFGEPKNTSISSALGTFMLTTKKQMLLIAKGNLFFNEDKWNMSIDARFIKTTQETNGLGTPAAYHTDDTPPVTFDDYIGYSESQKMNYRFVKIQDILFKKIDASRFFVGLGYHLDYHYDIQDLELDLEAEPQQLTSHYSYNTKYGFSTDNYITSGISLNFLYDNRDNSINAYSGRYFLANYRINGKSLGSAQNSSLLWVEYRDFYSISKSRPRNLIAFWTYNWFQTSGRLPYLDLPALGYDLYARSGRAYSQGYFRGEDLCYNELEYRFPILKRSERLGGVVFGNSTTASDRTAGVKLYEKVYWGYGAGIRLMIDRKSRTNINIDYAFGSNGEQGFYLMVNEVF